MHGDEAIVLDTHPWNETVSRHGVERYRTGPGPGVAVAVRVPSHSHGGPPTWRPAVWNLAQCVDASVRERQAAAEHEAAERAAEQQRRARAAAREAAADLRTALQGLGIREYVHIDQDTVSMSVDALQHLVAQAAAAHNVETGAWRPSTGRHARAEETGKETRRHYIAIARVRHTAQQNPLIHPGPNRPLHGGGIPRRQPPL